MSYFNKIEIGSFSGSVSTGSDDQLKVTPFSSDGVEGVKLINASGSSIGSHVMPSGMNHLAVASIQAIANSPENTYTGSLAVDASFTGSGILTSGIDIVKIFAVSDQNLTLYIDQSSSPVFTDNQYISDEFNTISNVPVAESVNIVGSYIRLRVKNSGMATTSNLAAGIGLVPVGNVLPRTLSHGTGITKGRLETETTIRDQQVHRHTSVTLGEELITTSRVRILGKSFTGRNKDTRFWTEETTNSGSVEISGELILSTGTDPSGSAKYYTVHKARFLAGSTHELKFFGKLNQDPAVGYQSKAGLFNDTDGLFFIIRDTDFGVGSMNSGSEDIVWNNNFNGNYGLTVSGDFSNIGRFKILYEGNSAEYYLNDTLIHTKDGDITPLVAGFDLPIGTEIINSGSTNDNSFSIRGVEVFRAGLRNSSPIFHQQSGVNAGILLKSSAGSLHSVVNTDNAGTMQLYDGIDDTGTLIADIDLAKVVGTLVFNTDYSNGLYLVQTSALSATTTVYE